MSIAPLLVEQDGTTVDMVLFNERLRRQQYRQDLHDHRYHTDIYVLPKAKRLTHLVLHHCKYVSELVLKLDTWTPEWNKGEINGWQRFERRAIDGLIICLSTANICGRHLPGSYATMPWTKVELQKVMINGIGKMAKTIEDIDHMGQVNPLGDLMAETNSLFSGYVECLRLMGHPFWTLTDVINTRLLDVESKHMWHNNYIEEIDRLMEEYDDERIING